MQQPKPRKSQKSEMSLQENQKSQASNQKQVCRSQIKVGWGPEGKNRGKAYQSDPVTPRRNAEIAPTHPKGEK